LRSIRYHAVALYLKVLPELKGVDKARAEQRMPAKSEDIVKTTVVGNWNFTIPGKFHALVTFSGDGTALQNGHRGKWTLKDGILTVKWDTGAWDSVSVDTGKSKSSDGSLGTFEKVK